MESKKIKLLFKSRKGILLKTIPKSLELLQKIIEHYYEVDPKQVFLTFLDTEKDECEIIDELTYQAACEEFPNKIVINISQYIAPQLNRLSSTMISVDRKSLKFFKKKGRKMAVFDIESETVEWISFPTGVLFKEYAAWVELPTGEIFYSGGGHPVSSNETFLLNPYTQTFKLLPSMTEARHSHGIAYSNGSVYVMGGIKNVLYIGTFIKDCEKYNLDEGKWERMYDMEVARGDTSALAMNDKLLIFGKGSPYLVEYNSDQFRLDLQEDQGGCMSFVDGLLYIFHGSKIKICNVSNKQVIEEHKLPRKGSWWSHCPPVVHKDFIYFIWWEEPGWICRFDRITKEFRKIISL